MPTGAGFRSGRLSIDYDNGGGVNVSAVRDLQAVATNRAYLSIFDSEFGGCDDTCNPYFFGTIGVGMTIERTFRVVNNGAVATTSIVDGGALLYPFSYKNSSFPGTGGTCTGTVASGTTCTLVLIFGPGIAGTFPGTVDLTYQDGLGATQSTRRRMSGTGQ